ncbi:MAG: hybrid sensor histidine kinase/response regulator [Rhodospirillales bacterium]|nr:hybrid sensor histidine kinase/response regulator [Rhodospirillales bacterium]
MTEFVLEDGPPTHGSSRILALAGMLLLVATILMTGFIIWDLRDDTINRYRQDMDTLGLALAEQSERSMDSVDLVLQQIQQQIDALRIATPSEFSSRLGGDEFGRVLRDRGRTAVQADGFVLVDSGGYLINSSNGMATTQVNLSDRDYFVHFLKDDDKSSFIGRPVPNRLTGERAYYVVRRIDSAAGEFLGLIVARMELASFERQYNAVVPPDGGSIALFRRDGTILARAPEGHAAIGTKISPASRWWRVVEHGGGSYRSSGQFEEEARIVSIHLEKRFPLVLGVTVLEEAALNHWRWQAMIIGAAFLVISLCAGFVLYWSLRQYRQLQASARKLVLHNVELQDNRRRLEQQAGAAAAIRVSERKLVAEAKALEK